MTQYFKNKGLKLDRIPAVFLPTWRRVAYEIKILKPIGSGKVNIKSVASLKSPVEASLTKAFGHFVAKNQGNQVKYKKGCDCTSNLSSNSDFQRTDHDETTGQGISFCLNQVTNRFRHIFTSR